MIGGTKMSKIIKVFRDSVPAMRFICKKYGDYSGWGEWFENGLFDKVEAAMGGVDSITNVWKNGGGYVGLEMRRGNELVYAVGMFTPAGTSVPEGLDFIDFPASEFGTCWIYGKEEDVHGCIGGCKSALAEHGFEIACDGDGYEISFENGLCPRFTTPDENGCVILDYCYFVK